MAKVAYYCTCGASLTVTTNDPGGWRRFVREWQSGHQGPGHASCDAQTASRARAKAENDYFTELEASRA